ncbi:class I SAM-dependent methyltransferase [Sphingomonas parva]|uniref:Class I SAM-dependent methyltransferase n=1 Tax=Sphingomonas parva TaxID=2555898 RepID=A0A4Y8ZPQ9_9SPHN|nr:class I SAM-dependent methyltransferase [Sphingomonas parva]TFI57991.1 class I SAM-dependent methyltransferase [Sphingomonas parva]
MGVTQSANGQAIVWNGDAGRAWVEAQDLLDTLFAPIETLLADEVAAIAPRDVLDVGCGTGATTISFARRLGAGGHVVGVDISEAMIEAARERASAARIDAAFLCADAATHGFETAAFDTVASRFGVMFFDDPVRALANLRRAVRAGGALRFLVWRGMADNPFMVAAERAAAPLLPDLPPRHDDAPGQFGFADPVRVRRLHEQAGWSAVEVRPVDFPCSMAEADLETYFTRLGPVARVLGTLDETLRARVVEAVRAAFEPYVHGDEVRFTAACWLVSATAA